MSKSASVLMSKIEKVSFEIARSNDDEAIRLIMQWRNDSETRRQSFNSEIKVWPEFRVEFLTDYANDPKLPPIFAVLEGRRVAFLRFRRLKDESFANSHKHLLPAPIVDISINVAPAERYRGVGKLILSRIDSLVTRLEVSTVLAEVKVDNKISARIFESVGFKYLDCIDHVNQTGEICKVNRYFYCATPKCQI